MQNLWKSFGIIVCVAAVTLLVLFGLRALFTSSPASTTVPANQNPATGLPTSSDTQGSSGGAGQMQATSTLTLTGVNGQQITVNNFLQDGQTVPDTVNPGYYYLAGSVGYCLANGTCPSGTPTNDFTITYHDSNHGFNITLLKEPLAQSRTEAEQLLVSRLGITQDQLCILNYGVWVPQSVNFSFSGQNLGFSFCAGATALPQ